MGNSAEEYMNEHDCVLDGLRIVLIKGGKGKTLQWCVAHASDVDPIPKAWRGATAQFMRNFLESVGMALWWNGWPSDWKRLACRRCFEQMLDRKNAGRDCASCAAVIRARFPSLTLAVVIEAAQAHLWSR